MRNSIKRPAKNRRNSFNSDFDRQEDDLLLADIKVIPDDSRLTITPLNHPVNDQDDIDRLMVNSGFETRFENTVQDDDAFAVIGDIGEDQNAAQRHYDYVETTENTKPAFTEATITAASELDWPADNHSDMLETIAPITVEPDFTPLAGEIDGPEKIVEITIEPLINVNGFVDNSQPAAKQTENPAEHKTTHKPAKSLPQTTGFMAYLLIGITCTTLAVTCLLGFMVYDLKSAVNQIKQQMTVLKEGIEVKEASDKYP